MGWREREREINRMGGDAGKMHLDVIHVNGERIFAF